MEGHAAKEDVSFHREGGHYPVETILEVVLEVLGAGPASLKRRSMNSMIRPVTACALCRHGGLTQRQAADAIDLGSGVAVSLQKKVLHEQIESTKKVREILTHLTNRLRNPKHRNLVLNVWDPFEATALRWSGRVVIFHFVRSDRRFSSDAAYDRCPVEFFPSIS